MLRPLLAWCCLAVLGATTVDLELEALALTDALPRLQVLTGEDLAADPDLVTARPEVNLVLAGADRRAWLQALAHAAGAWYLDDREVLLTRADRLPVDPERARVVTYKADLAALPDAGAVVRTFVAPWLDGAIAGIGHDPATGTWSATMDPAGHSHLAALLPMLEQGRPLVPTLIPLPPSLPDRTVADRLEAVSWRRLVLALGRATGVSVSVGPGVLLRDRRDPDPPPPIPAGTGLAAACDFLDGQGLAWRWLDGVICVDTDAPESRRHPALRWRLAVIPVGHLVDQDQAPAFLERIRTEVVPGWWRHPGAGLAWLPAHASLVAAADDPTMLALLDWIRARDDGR